MDSNGFCSVNVRNHKGPRTKGLSKAPTRKPKLSSIRREAIFSGSAATVVSQSGNTTPRDRAGQALSVWVSNCTE